MSRRESRDSDSKRQRSRFDRELSPKRSRRDGKPEAERVLTKDLDVRDTSDTDKKPRQSLRDAVPLEPDARDLSKDGEKKHSGNREAAKRASHLSELPRSRPYYQHDELRSAGKSDRRPTSERGWYRSSRDESNRRTADGERSQHRKDEDKSTWRHDKFHEINDTQGGAVTRKRPAFRENKISDESGNTRTEEPKESLNNRRQNDRNWRSNLHLERHERPPMGRDRVWNRDDDRDAGNRQSYRADRDNRFIRQGGFRGNETREEKKWDHDLFEEANKSPVKVSEEEQIAKVEALLAA